MATIPNLAAAGAGKFFILWPSEFTSINCFPFGHLVLLEIVLDCSSFYFHLLNETSHSDISVLVPPA